MATVLNNLSENLLEIDNFSVEKDSNIENLRLQVKRGNLGISLSSFEDIYYLTPDGVPFPIGTVNFEDGKKRFVISWREDFSKLKIDNIEDYTLRIRHYPTANYSIVSLIIGLNSGKIDPETKEDIWYYGEIHLDISLMLTRVKLYQLLNSHEILFCFFDGNIENLDSYGFSLNNEELTEFSKEIDSIIKQFPNYEKSNYLKLFTEASNSIKTAFNKNGLPKSKDALEIYLRRKSINPKPGVFSWKEYLSI
ncbi:MAG: hypothetical protein JXR64_00010 [Spirochaetales bacterium]|nr:hypothetical protein [Spirochaetales bacterium]